MAFYVICFFWICNLFSRSAQAKNREITASALVRLRAGRRLPVQSSMLPTAMAIRLFCWVPPIITRAPRSPSRRARITPPSTSPGSRQLDSICLIGKKSWGSILRFSSSYVFLRAPRCHIFRFKTEVSFRLVIARP